MSKDQKKNVELSVETVENLRFLIDWIPSSIEFWGEKERFPFNLICDSCQDLAYKLTQEINKNCVS